MDRTNWRKSTDLTPGRSSLSEIGFGEISLMRMLMSNLRAILQATAVDTFEQLRSLIMLDKRSKKDIHRYKRNAILWYRVNNVIRSGMTSLYTHLDITEVFIGLLKNSESQLPFAHGICTGLCEERVFTGLARTVLRDVAADFVAVVRHGSVYITPSRGSSKMRSIPNSASAQFSSPNKTSGGETLGYLDLKKAFHFVHNYFVMQNYEFFGPDIPGDLCCANPMKATAKAYFSFLRMCISFIIEILEPTITSKIYLKSIFEGNGLGNPVDPSLLLGGRLLYEMLALGLFRCI